MQIQLQLLFFICFIFQTTCVLVSSALECITSQNPSKVAYTITVSQSGDANFTTIADALSSIPPNNNKWIKIFLKPGTYKEQIQIEWKECIFLEGSDSTTTTITFEAHDTTSESCTFSVDADNFLAKGITFKNSYNRVLKGVNPNPVPAVALKISGDKHAFYSCGFEGYQDTLWDDHGRHYFNSCYIEGAVDFIWGNGQSVYEQCAINVTGGGFITAQGRESANETSGFVFRGCKISGTGHADLGRAYRSFSRVIFINSSFSNVVNAEGWFIWNQQGHEKDVTYAEVDCTGPGADISKRVPWMKKLEISEVGQYVTQEFIDQDGWIARQPI
ncbi:probable pectinesterase 55 [Beta vulgaris subsp. vulgaris]|uniref:probable pectinesterase 55 n=1 Tax=Beta vulgaris subsp. vulgaris TaxID=3555 RepID=UPI0025476848|nr:probable pectinesterase 55 [Beta vulgaris subsp. vulgaris]